MLPSLHFDPLPIEYIQNILMDKTKVDQILVFKLTGGNILMGTIFSFWEWDGNIVQIEFNTEEGRTHKRSYIADLPLQFITDISIMPLSQDSYPIPYVDPEDIAFFKSAGAESLLPSSVAVYDFPNPLASIISNNNLEVASIYNIDIHEYIRKSLSKDAIPPDGIKLTEDFVLYADREFYNPQSNGLMEISINISIFGINKIFGYDLDKAVIRSINNNRKSIYDKNKNDFIINGFISNNSEHGDNLKTIMQGEDSIIMMCLCISPEKEGEFIPILIKKKYLSYPLEFINYISSPLVFYGKYIPLPIKAFNMEYEYTLMVKAIAFIKNNKNINP